MTHLQITPNETMLVSIYHLVYEMKSIFTFYRICVKCFQVNHSQTTDDADMRYDEGKQTKKNHIKFAQ